MVTDQLKSDLKEAQLSKDEIRVSTIRMLLSEVHNAQITLRQSSGQEKDLSENEITALIQKEVKKRKEAADSFRLGNRLELAEKEESEAQILSGYLPEQLSDEELTDIVQGVITEIGANSIADMGKVIGVVMGKVAGKVEGARVSAVVKDKLTK